MNLIQLNADEMFGDKPPIEPTEGCWIAGGSVRRWFTGQEKLSDVDVFGVSVAKLNEFQVARLSAFESAGSNPNANSFSDGKVLVQLIVGKPFPTVAEMFSNFDFTLCQFAWTMDGIFTTKEAILSVLRNRLSVQKINPDFAMDSLRRAFKYQRKGFEPCNGTMLSIANALSGLDKEAIKAQVAISPGGGTRILRFD